MPRPAASGRKGHHGSRHENGLVVPGRKVVKQKSNGHLNGSANGAVHAEPPADNHNASSPRPTSRFGEDNSNGPMGKTEAEVNGHIRTHEPTKGEPLVTNGHPRPPSSTNDGVSGDRGIDNHILPADAKCALGTVVKKFPSSTSINPFMLASTILKSCPMSDTIAILIFLLQLPPIVLTLVQFLFASLTFMPPAGVSTGSLTSNFDIFQGPAGTPSLGTMIAMDAFCLLVWGLFMWTWAQNFAIDLAQVQVAITLGGGSSGKNGGVNAGCVLIILGLHLLRSNGVQNFVLGHLISANLMSSETLSKCSHLFPGELRRKDPPSAPGWIRSLLAVHILAQAGTAMARRSMAKNRLPPPTKSSRRTDTEASAGSHNQLESGTAFESTAPATSGVGSDVSIPSHPIAKDKDRISSTKKRRRQANQVRSRQPFWAALASTKVTVMREYDNSKTRSWSPEFFPGTKDDVEFASHQEGLIWITQIDSSCIKFAASNFRTIGDPVLTRGSYDSLSSATDSCPFYVRVNGTFWATVTLSKVSEDAEEPGLVHWRGEVWGLAPDCTYTCNFIQIGSEEELCTVTVKTPPAPDADQVTAFQAASTSPRPSLRPTSPTTTIKNSIKATEAKLNERRSRLKKAKNDHKVHIARLKKELDSFNQRLNSGGDENRQKQRSLQLERNIRQTEEAAAVIEVQLDNLVKAPDDELEEWNSHKADFEKEMEHLNTCKAELDGSRAAANRDVSSARSELAAAVQKRERLQSRKTRLSEQYERLSNANSQGINERERRLGEQLLREREHARIEETFHQQLTSITRSIQDYQIRTTQLWQQASAIEQAYQQQQKQQQHQQQLLMDTGPVTPEGDLPGTIPRVPELTTAASNRSLLGLSYSGFNGIDSKSGFGAQTTSPRIVTTSLVPVGEQEQYPSPSLSSVDPFLGPITGTIRHRSLSNLSNRGIIPEDFAPQQLTNDVSESAEHSRRLTSGFIPGIGRVHRAGSRGSGSGSLSGSGSGSPRSIPGKMLPG